MSSWSSMTNYTFYERQDVVTETIDAAWAWRWSGDADVRVPAGRFRGCHGLDVAWGSNSGRAYDWFCSGIGLVRHDYHDYGTGYGDNAMELVAYDIPPLVARDAPPLPTTTATPTKTPAARVARRTMSLIRQ